MNEQATYYMVVSAHPSVLHFKQGDQNYFTCESAPFGVKYA